MREALAQVKQELGGEAVILGTRWAQAGGIGRLVGRDQVEITATTGAAPQAKATRAATGGAAKMETAVRAPALPEQLYPHYLQLVQNEVAEELAARLLQAAAREVPGGKVAGGRVLGETLRRCIAEMVPTAGPVAWVPGTLRRVALVGPSGGGKTTTLAKLAAHFKLRLRKDVRLLSLDMQRLAANEQLRRYAEIIRVPMESAQTAPGVHEALKRCEGADCVLIDTPGVGLREQGRFARLAMLLRAARADEVHLVLPASLTPGAQTRLGQSFAPLGVSRVVLTHLDEAVGFGVVLNAVERLKCHLSYLSAGQNVPRDIEEACGQRVAELILPLEK
jgi:flagellar biosynthesis protein FlhF